MAGARRRARDLWAAMRGAYMPLTAAGVAFFGMLAVVPSLAVLVSVAGVLGGPDHVPSYVAWLTRGFPREARSLVLAELREVIARQDARFGVGLGLGGLLALWSASRAVATVLQAIGIVSGRGQDLGYARRRGVAMAVTAAALVLVPLGVVIVSEVPVLGRALGTGWETVGAWARWPVLGFLAAFVFGGLYRIGAGCKEHPWSRFGPGAVAAALTWLGGTWLMAGVVGFTEEFDRFYGSFTAVVVLMLWLYGSALVVLGGAALNRELERAAGTALEAQASHA